MSTQFAVPSLSNSKVFLSTMEEIDDYSEAVDDTEGGYEIERRKNSVFSQLKLHCLELLELLQNPKKHCSALSSLLQILQQSPSFALQPFFDYTLFPLLLLLDAAVDSRSSKSVDSEEKFEIFNSSKSPHRVSDIVAEGVLQCLEELLRKCHLGSVEQMVVVLKKLTYGALLSPADASEEFREGIIKCFRALILSLLPCSDESCLCKQTFSLPLLVDNRDLETLCGGSVKYGAESDECLLAFFQSQTASAAVGHWLSLLLKAADVEAARGHRGSAKLRSEAFITLRVLVAKVGNADALAFFLPGVVSQYAKVLHASKRMASGAVGSVEALDQAIRGLAEFLMIVLQDDAYIGDLDACTDITKDFNSNKCISTQSFMEELRHLPIKAQDQNNVIKENSSVKGGESNQKLADSGCEIGSLRVDRTKEWMEKTSAHVDKLLVASFPHMCIHPAKKVRLGLLAAIQGLLLKCSYALKQSRPMLLECLCALVVDESEEVSAAAQEFIGHSFASSRKSQLEHDLAGIFDRLIDKLPKVVLGSEESVAISVAQQLLVIMYYSGPQFVVEHLLQSPVTAAHFMDIIALCLSQNSVYAGSLNKLISRSSSAGYVDSIAELKAGTNFVSDCLTVVTDAPRNSKIAAVRDAPYLEENMQKNYELPRMPPWFVYIGSVKLYQVLSGILRLVGLSSVADFRGGAHLLLITEIPLGHLRKLVSEVRSKQYHEESWQSWYNRTGAGQLLRQGSTAACILNEIMYGTSDQAIDFFTRTFQKSWIKKKEIQGLSAGFSDCQPYKIESTVLTESLWKIPQENDVRNHLIDCVGRILHEYLTPEVWDLPLERKSSLAHPDNEDEDISLYFFNDTAMLHQVIIEGIGIANISLGNNFSSSGFLHLSLYLLLESLISSNYHVRTASDAVLHVIAATSGHPTVGHLVLANADYVIDSICRQLRHLDLNLHVPNVLAAMLSYIGLANKILPLLEEPMRSVSRELEILGRNQHPQLTIPFLKAVAEICKASKRESYSLALEAHSYFMHVHSIISDVENKQRAQSTEVSVSYDNFDLDEEAERWENIVFKLNDSKRYRRTVGSIAGSCSMAVTPLLAAGKQAACLVALDIVEDAVLTLAKVEAAYKHERDTKEAIEEMLELCALYQLKDTLDVADEGADENRLLPAMNKIWPFLVICVQIKIPPVVRRCISVVSKVVQICGGDFFSRRFRTDGPHFWKLLTTSPFFKKPNFKEDRIPLQLPYRSITSSSEDSLAESSHIKVQAAVLNMIADLSRNKHSASALELVLKKVTGLAVGIACSGIIGLRDASLNALQGLGSIDPDLVWLLLADVYYSMKKDLPSPPISELPEIFQILPPPSSTKEFLHVQYGGQSYGFDIDFSSVEIIFQKLHSQVFCYQMYS